MSFLNVIGAIKMSQTGEETPTSTIQCFYSQNEIYFAIIRQVSKWYKQSFLISVSRRVSGTNSSKWIMTLN